MQDDHRQRRCHWHGRRGAEDLSRELRICLAEDEDLSSLQDSVRKNGGGRGASLVFFARPAASAWPEADCYLLRATFFLGLERRERPFPSLVMGSPALLYRCLREGALDFLEYPPNPEELAARLVGRLAMETEANPGLEPAVRLGPREARLLGLLQMAGGSVITREALQFSLWGRVHPASRRLDMLVSSLRHKLASDRKPTGIEIVAERGEGYSLRFKPVDNLWKS